MAGETLPDWFMEPILQDYLRALTREGRPIYQD